MTEPTTAAGRDALRLFCAVGRFSMNGQHASDMRDRILAIEAEARAAALDEARAAVAAAASGNIYYYRADEKSKLLPLVSADGALAAIDALREDR